MPSSFVDLHSHSTASDGTLPPADVVRLAVQVGLSALALTDHDTIAGVEEAAEEAKRSTSISSPASKSAPNIPSPAPCICSDTASIPKAPPCAISPKLL